MNTRRRIQISFRNYLVLAVAVCLLGIGMTGEAWGIDWGRWGRRVAKKAIENRREIAKAFKGIDLSPEQEYYIGRAVAANILKQYRVYRNPKATRYVNLIGSALARFCDRPETFGGYHFLILDTNEINAFAAPGGFVFVTRGLLACCKSEDEVAAVLAHEIAHVRWQHGLRSIRAKRLSSVGGILAGEIGAELAGGRRGVAGQMSKVFGGSVNDVTGFLLYSRHPRATEAVADETALIILKRVGYDARGFLNVLAEMGKRLPRRGRTGFAATHPSPAWRSRHLLGYMKDKFGDYQAPPAPLKRQKRFRQALGDIAGGAVATGEKGRVTGAGQRAAALGLSATKAANGAGGKLSRARHSRKTTAARTL